MADKNTWPKSISVDRRIVKILSESTYENFPTALKEIITNSYDADASEVKITVDNNKELIIINDDGKGMSEEEFDFFLRIAGAKRDTGKSTTSSGRLIVGKFGVGFLSIFPYFKNYNIESSKKGSDKVLLSSIPCYKYFSSGTLLDVSEIPIQGSIKIDKSKVQQSYTRITLSGFTDLAKQYFKRKSDSQHKQHTILGSNSIQKLKWRLEEDLPLEYDDPRFNVLTHRYSPNQTFKVYLNKEQLFRRTFGKQLLEVNTNVRSFNRMYGKETLEVNAAQFKQIGKIKFQYFILTDKKSIHPYEARAIKRRNLNIGVGERTAYGLGTEIKGARSRLQWLTGEVLIIDGLNDLINVQRTEFYFDLDYELLKEFIIERLSYHSNQLEEEAEYTRQEKDQRIKKLSYIEDEPEEFEDNEKTQKKPSPQKASPDPKISKSISVHGKSYKVRIGKWDFKKDIFPACKIEEGKIIINKSYPLFRGIKYTDVFIKLHLLLVISFKEKTLDKSTYLKMSKEVLDIYEDYI